MTSLMNVGEKVSQGPPPSKIAPRVLGVTVPYRIPQHLLENLCMIAVLDSPRKMDPASFLLTPSTLTTDPASGTAISRLQPPAAHLECVLTHNMLLSHQGAGPVSLILGTPPSHPPKDKPIAKDALGHVSPVPGLGAYLPLTLACVDPSH